MAEETVKLAPLGMCFLCAANGPADVSLEWLCEHAVTAQSDNGEKFVVTFPNEAAAQEYIARGPAKLRPFKAGAPAEFEATLKIFVRLGWKSLGMMEAPGESVRLYPISQIMAVIRRGSN